MRLSPVPVLAAAAVLAPAAHAQRVPIILRPGERVAISMEGPAQVAERGEAIPRPLDLAAAEHLAGVTPPPAPVTEAAPLPVPGRNDLVEDRVVVRWIDAGPRQTLMVLDNGYDRAVRYRAAIVVNGRETPTDVCLLLPSKSTYENWPYASEQIALSDFAFVDWDGGRVPCA